MSFRSPLQSKDSQTAEAVFILVSTSFLDAWFHNILVHSDPFPHLLLFPVCCSAIRAGLPHNCWERSFPELALFTAKQNPLSPSRLWETSTVLTPTENGSTMIWKDSIKTHRAGALLKGNSCHSRECTMEFTVFLRAISISIRGPSNILVSDFCSLDFCLDTI